MKGSHKLFSVCGSDTDALMLNELRLNIYYCPGLKYIKYRHG